MSVPETESQPSAPTAKPAAELKAADLQAGLKTHFGFDSFRAYQEDICASVLAGDDSLVVMPTGQGKSLCYQLPGILRGGVTLVISPLIALMEDQVGALKAKGLTAERIHSGRSRDQSREACVLYRAGELQFLFLSPERLGVPRMGDFLVKYPPTLIAIDEAHCISVWGHDFRPDYRLLAERLEQFGAVPRVAFTATATTMVQRDIVRQLQLREPKLHIHGFRRDNIAIESVPISAKERPGVVVTMLQEPGALPAVVYCATRKQTEQVQRDLAKKINGVGFYHAGLTTQDRDRVQTMFLDGRYQVLVATIAFGMGVDKDNIRSVIHLSLPQSLEGYYQEIGRGGRDGKPSRATLFYSRQDFKTLNFLLGRSYPPVEDLIAVLELIPEGGIMMDDLAAVWEDEKDMLETLVAKLTANKAVRVSRGLIIASGEQSWQTSYVRQQAYKQESLAKVWQYFQNRSECRMIQITEFFGDTDCAYDPCGLCEICAPEDAQVQNIRQPTPLEIQTIGRLLSHLGQYGRKSLGKLFQAICEPNLMAKEPFDRLIDAVMAAKLIHVTEKSFRRGGVEIFYKDVDITNLGRQATAEHYRSIPIMDIKSRFKRGFSGRGTSGRSTSGRSTPRRRADAQSP